MTQALKEKSTETVRKQSPRYKVLLHNDEHNSMEYVVISLKQVLPSLSTTQAANIMMQAHLSGKGLVTVCDIEPAEFYCECLKSKNLISSIEPE